MTEAHNAPTGPLTGLRVLAIEQAVGAVVPMGGRIGAVH